MPAADFLCEHYRGCVVGSVVGSLLGRRYVAHVEREGLPVHVDALLSSDTVYPLTDDARLLLEVAQSYLLRRNLDLSDITERMLHWYHQKPRPLGNQTWTALLYLEQNIPPAEAGRLAWEQSGRQAAGSGGLRRCAPVALARAFSHALRETETRLLCQITHYDPRCVDSCLFANRLIAALLKGDWHTHTDTMRYLVGLAPSFCQAIQAAPALPLVSLVTGGYTITTLQSAYRLLLTADDLLSALFSLFQRGGQVSTVGLVAGALLGARFGLSVIPTSLQQSLPYLDDLLQTADQLLDLAQP